MTYFEHIIEIKKIPAHSESSTYYYLVKLDVNNIRNGFLKLGINPISTISDNNGKNYSSIDSTLLDTFNDNIYEIDVYRLIKRCIYDTGICDNFVKIISYSKTLVFEDVSRIFNNYIEEDGEFYSGNKDLYLNYITYDLFKNGDGNETIDYTNFIKKNILKMNSSEYKQSKKIDSSRVLYTYILCESMESNLKFHEMLFDTKNEEFYTSTKSLSTTQKDCGSINYEFYNIIFKIAYTCHILDIFEISHNDLHPGNVYIKTNSSTTMQRYIVNGVNYDIYSKYDIYIYDYDRSNATNILGDKYEYERNIRHFKGKNFYKNFVYYFNYFYKKMNTDYIKEEYFSIIFSEGKSQEKIMNDIFKQLKGVGNIFALMLEFEHVTDTGKEIYKLEDVVIGNGNFFESCLKPFEELIGTIYEQILKRREIVYSNSSVPIKVYTIPSIEKVKEITDSAKEYFKK
jgi:hypothetical protein